MVYRVLCSTHRLARRLARWARPATLLFTRVYSQNSGSSRARATTSHLTRSVPKPCEVSSLYLFLSTVRYLQVAQI